MSTLNCFGKIAIYRKLIEHVEISLLIKFLMLLSIICALIGSEVRAQATLGDNAEVPIFAFDEVPVRVMVEGYKIFYIDAIYGNNKFLFVNVEDLFNTLNIPCISAQQGNSVSGFIENESRTYSIDFENKQIKIGTKIINTRNGLKMELGALYMETSLFGEAFGITLTFNYRMLTILLKSNFELPILKQLRIEKLRTNLSRIKGEVVADTIVKRNYHLLKFGTVDWSLGSTQSWNGSTDNRFGFGVGTELLYGEADVAIDYYSQYKFDNRQVHYLWRWVDNDKTIIKQAQLGKISNQTISFVNSPIVGAVVRNTPTTIRKASGYYAINEFTEPNWSVELYINNVMVDYTKADASGLFHFKVPIVYGYTTLKLKFYGPMGEERTDERTMNIPYTIMPEGEFEYGLSGGIVQDSSSSRFGKAEFNYGMNRILTVGGGLEYLSSISKGAYIPYLTATIQPFSKLTINGEYAHGVRASGLVNYYFRKDVLLEVNYAKYVKGQLATRFNAPEERKMKLSIPLRLKKVTGFSKFDYTQRVYKTFNYNEGNFLFSAYYQKMSVSSVIQLNWISNQSAYFIYDLALSYRMKNGITIRPSAQYNLSEGNLRTCKLAIEKYIPRGNFSISYERNVLYRDNFINIGFKYDLSFARTNISATHSHGNIITSQSIQGSLAFGSGNGYIYASNNSSVSKGGISLYPFLDLNNNGIFDTGEHMVKITSVSIMGGKIIFSKKDSIIRIPDLNAFTNYLVELKDNDLENIAWRFKKRAYQVLIDPNQFKRIDIPIVAVGEVSGMAYLNKDNSLKGIRRILVKFYEKNSNKLVAETLSESDGYIYYMGLDPGEYTASVDPEQLSALKMSSSPELIPINITQSFDGAIVGGLDFILSPVQEQLNSTVKSKNPVEPVKVAQIQIDTSKIGTSEPSDSQMSIIEYEGDVLQFGAFKIKSNAFALLKKLSQITDKPAIILYEDGYYKVRIPGFANRRLARKYASLIPKVGSGLFYVPVIKSNTSIQVGEYKKEENALCVQTEWIERSGKSVVILFGNDLYKVRIPGFPSKKEAESFIAYRAKAQNTMAHLQNAEDKDDRVVEIVYTRYSAIIQVGAFVRKENALEAEQILVKSIDHPVKIIIEDGFYKVLISGFSGRNKAIDFLPHLIHLGFSTAYVARIKSH
jgi:hypothetical protein